MSTTSRTTEIDARRVLIYTPARFPVSERDGRAGQGWFRPDLSPIRTKSGLSLVECEVNSRYLTRMSIPLFLCSSMSAGVSRKGFHPMDAKSRVPARCVIMVCAASAGMLSLVGCSLGQERHSARQDVCAIGGHSGELSSPSDCLLKVAIISRPFDDALVKQVVWKAADEQIIPPKDRRAWEVNGLRVGRIIGELPLELEAIMNDTTCHQKVSPTDIIVESGEPTLIKISDPVEQATCF